MEGRPINADTLRLSFTYVIAILILVGSFILLLLPSQVDNASLLPFITGIIGIVLGFVFNRESTTAGARAQERAVSLGAATSLAGGPAPVPETLPGKP
jgi:hypothetical protein